MLSGHFIICPEISLCSVAKPFSQNCGRVPAPANRFLFIVDTSASMEHHSREVQQLVVDLLASSASGQIHFGDTIGLWTFNADVYTGNLPLQKWLPADGWKVSARIADFLRQQRYGNKSRFDKVLADMFEIIKISDVITVFLISNGEGKMQGSPFDAEINAAYKENLKEMRKGPDADCHRFAGQKWQNHPIHGQRASLAGGGSRSAGCRKPNTVQPAPLPVSIACRHSPQNLARSPVPQPDGNDCRDIIHSPLIIQCESACPRANSGRIPRIQQCRR